MKRILMIAILAMMGGFAFGQRVVNDPSYSVNNYKHPNKARYAKEHHLDKSTELVPVTVDQHENYKQPYTKEKTKKFALASSAAGKKSGTSYKHPYGL